MKKTQSKWRRRDFILLGAAVVLCIVFSLWQNNALTVTNYRMESNKPLPQDGLRIVQLSDLHNKWFGNGQKRLLTELRAQNPDLIVCTGDMVDSRRTEFAPALVLAEALTEIAQPIMFPETTSFAFPTKCAMRFMTDSPRAG